MHLVRTTAMTAVTMIGAGAAALAAGRYAGDALLRNGPDRPLPGEPRLTVRAVDETTVTLDRTPASCRPGTYGLTGRDLHAVVGPPVADVSHPHDRVVRRLERITHGVLRPGLGVRLTPQVLRGDPREALGLGPEDVDDLELPGETGPLPAWFLPGARDTYVVTAHGLGATREQPMALLPFLRRMRLPALLPAHRGDPGAPRPADGLDRLGAAEWRDVVTAVDEAV
ncbi:hypothetical protein JNW98_30160, partial [Streptomyces sp. SCA2-4]|nr:hypothetical protein [Streptomyces huiliensis]